jgi:hypothetical protein
VCVTGSLMYRACVSVCDFVCNVQGVRQCVLSVRVRVGRVVYQGI